MCVNKKMYLRLLIVRFYQANVERDMLTGGWLISSEILKI